ncbi:hypothetical protein [Anabaena sp. FACHB-1237]|uniref:hypothetical protein n=1 Tax=Anabaena sp. FACHB-1237 TaxID=2692769 RepID=UPI001F556626
MIKNDIWIKEMAQKGIISPFESSLIRHAEGIPVISYRPSILNHAKITSLVISVT